MTYPLNKKMKQTKEAVGIMQLAASNNLKTHYSNHINFHDYCNNYAFENLILIFAQIYIKLNNIIYLLLFTNTLYSHLSFGSVRKGIVT